MAKNVIAMVFCRGFNKIKNCRGLARQSMKVYIKLSDKFGLGC